MVVVAGIMLLLAAGASGVPACMELTFLGQAWVCVSAVLVVAQAVVEWAY